METEEMNSYAIDAQEARFTSEALRIFIVGMFEHWYQRGEDWCSPISGDHLNRATITG